MLRNRYPGWQSNQLCGPIILSQFQLLQGYQIVNFCFFFKSIPVPYGNLLSILIGSRASVSMAPKKQLGTKALALNYYPGMPKISPSAFFNIFKILQGISISKKYEYRFVCRLNFLNQIKLRLTDAIFFLWVNMNSMNTSNYKIVCLQFFN